MRFTESACKCAHYNYYSLHTVGSKCSVLKLRLYRYEIPADGDVVWFLIAMSHGTSNSSSRQTVQGAGLAGDISELPYGIPQQWFLRKR